ncbi:hypothetical protein [Chromobacterium piscinae]|uniref:hypothetical protein n=1 Tax=Chromobacterium piscinae TaxID=686831 RepID=UPI003261A156
MQNQLKPINSSDGQFQDGNPYTGALGTVVTSEWLNGVQSAVQSTQRELLKLLQDSKQDPDSNRDDQLLQAVRNIAWGGNSKPATLAGYGIAIASQTEAEAGMDNVKAMTPLRVEQALNAVGLSGYAKNLNSGSLQTVRANGLYHVDSSLVSGSPDKSNGMLLANFLNDKWGSQVYWMWGGATYEQRLENGNWQPWIKLLKTGQQSTLADYGITDGASKTDLQKAVNDLVAGAPGALNTLQELAAALGNDQNFAATIAKQLGNKADKATTLAGYGITDNVQRKNLVINGSFDIWQRGTSFRNPASGAYTADRWCVYYDGTPGEFTVGRQDWPVDSPSESSYYLQWNQATAVQGTTRRELQHRIESVKRFAGKACTLSFTAWSDVARTIQVGAAQIFATAPTANAVITPGQNINLTTVPQRFSVTLNLPAIPANTKLSDRNYLEIQFRLPNTGTFFSFAISDVQLEKGTMASEFETRPYYADLPLCQRYYETSYPIGKTPGAAYINGGNSNVCSHPGSVWFPGTTFKATKRAMPSITIYRPSTGDQGFIENSGELSPLKVSAVECDTNALGMVITDSPAVGATLWQYSWSADAEL